MASVNKAFLMGNLTRDPEVKYIPSGTAVCEFSIACNESYKDRDGNKKDSVTFVTIKAWGRTAEVVGEYSKKGSSVFVEGRLTTESWDDKTSGQKRSKMLVTADKVQLLGGKSAESQKPSGDDYACDSSDNPF